MASSIDATEPADGTPPAKADQRANWAAAKSEIEALQTDVAGKANTAHNHAAADITSGELTAPRYVDMVGDSGSGGTKGAVPAPTTGDATKFLKGDGTWATATAGAFSDDDVIVEGSADATKQLKIEVDGLTTSTIRTITMPDQNLDLTPTTGDFQASDAQLTDVAGLAVTDGGVIVGDGANFVLETGATLRTSLGLGTGDSPEFTAVNIGAATDTTITRESAGVIAVEGDTVAMLATAQEYTQTQNFNATTLSDGANISWDAAANQVCSVTLAGNRTLDAPTNQVDGAFYSLAVIQDGTGSRTLSFASGPGYKFAGGTAPTVSTGAADRDEFVFKSDGTDFIEIGRQLDVS
tara:strand:- start:7937 stop:8992 length:1056 start_codon:yes stop_codon:yes gene_type:complete